MTQALAIGKEVLFSLKGEGGSKTGDSALALGEGDADFTIMSKAKTEAIRKKMILGLRQLYRDRVSLSWMH